MSPQQRMRFQRHASAAYAEARWCMDQAALERTNLGAGDYDAAIMVAVFERQAASWQECAADYARRSRAA